MYVILWNKCTVYISYKLYANRLASYCGFQTHWSLQLYTFLFVNACVSMWIYPNSFYNQTCTLQVFKLAGCLHTHAYGFSGVPLVFLISIVSIIFNICLPNMPAQNTTSVCPSDWYRRRCRLSNKKIRLSNKNYCL